MSTSAPSEMTIQSMSGVVHGGQSPIQGAVVNLYHTSATATAYGQAGVYIGTATTDAGGNFTVSPSATSGNCPSGTYAYITAAGGYPSGSSSLANNSTLLMAMLGDCSTITSATTVVINELTTIAAAYALSGFITTSAAASLFVANVGAPAANRAAIGSATPTSLSGLGHAVVTAKAMVNPFNGQPNPTTAASSGGVTVAGSVPVVELNTLADIMASCVNSTTSGATGSTTSNACTLLYAATPSIAGSTPTNTLQAFVNLARNPASAAAMSGTVGLFSQISSTPPFVTALTTAPTDWALAICYNASTASALTLAKPYWLTLDANDTVYVGGSAVTTTTPALFGLSVYGNTVPLFGSMAAGTATRGIATDLLGNVWVDNNGTGLYRFSLSAGGAPAGTFTTLASATPIAIDAANNVWVGHAVSTVANVDEFAYNSTTTSWGTTANYTALTAANTYGLAVDANQNIWAGTYGSTTTVDVLANTGTASAPAYTSSGTVITPIAGTLVGAATHPYGVTFDASGNAWYGIYGTPPSATLAGLEEFVPNSTTALTSITGQSFIPGSTVGTGSTSGYTLGVQVTNVPAIDGAGTIFLPDNNGTGDLHIYSSTTGAVLSPTGGILACALAAGATTCGTGTTAEAIYNPRMPVIDSTGSVWLGWTNGGVTQLVGIAAPTYPVLAAGKPGLSPGLTAVNPLP